MSLKHKFNWVKEYRRIYHIQKELIDDKFAELKENLKPYETYLKAGRYRVVFTPRLMVFQDDANARFFLHNLKKHVRFKFGHHVEQSVYSKVRSWLITQLVKLMQRRVINSQSIHIDPQTSHEFNGSFLLTLNGQRFKIFDFEAYQSVTVGYELTDLKQLKEYHTLFKDYFDSPLLKIDLYRQTILEDIVTTMPYQEWTYSDAQLVIKEFLTRYSHYVLGIKEKYWHETPLDKIVSSVSFLQHNAQHQALVQTYLKSFLNEKLPISPAHGDLYFFNILKSKVSGRNHLIDFEHAQPLPFYFDGVWLILSAVFNSDDDTYLKHFFAGTYDHYFDTLFKAAKQRYAVEDKPKYCFISLYLANFYRNKDIFSEMESSQLDHHLDTAVKSFEKLEALIASYGTLRENRI